MVGAVLRLLHAHRLLGGHLAIGFGAALQAVDVSLLLFHAHGQLTRRHALRDAVGLAFLTVVHALRWFVGQAGGALRERAAGGQAEAGVGEGDDSVAWVWPNRLLKYPTLKLPPSVH